MTANFLSTPDGRKLAYTMSEGRLPGVVFCGGFKSDMAGSKALTLEAWCQKRGQRFVRFDYTGHGQSSGRFEEGTIGAWKRDALTILDDIATGDNVLVGSSMGGWIMLLAALARPDRVAGLVGIAAAPDFTEDLMWTAMTAEQRETLLRDGLLLQPSAYDPQPCPITRGLIEEGRGHLLLRAPVGIADPARLLHGMRDPDVPWETSLRLAERLASDDVQLLLIKDGDHRLSRPADLERLFAAVAALSGGD